MKSLFLFGRRWIGYLRLPLTGVRCFCMRSMVSISSLPCFRYALHMLTAVTKFICKYVSCYLLSLQPHGRSQVHRNYIVSSGHWFPEGFRHIYCYASWWDRLYISAHESLFLHSISCDIAFWFLLKENLLSKDLLLCRCRFHYQEEYEQYEIQYHNKCSCH